MKTCGIVVEYNPFHNGHLYHVEKAKEMTGADVVIAVMSGYFVQRGEPAIMNKWKRCELALQMGVDLVVELPCVYATQSAKQFAEASMKILDLLGVDDVVFGSECNDIEKLKRFASYPIQFHDKEESIVRQWSFQLEDLGANDILGTCYVRAIQENGYTMQAHTLKRTNDYHGEELNTNISSATAIRKGLKEQQSVHNYIPYNNLEVEAVLEDYYPYLQTILFNQKRDQLASLLLMDEGIEGLLKKEAIGTNLDDFLDACVNRRYTKSRIRRTLIHTLLQTQRSEVPNIQEMRHVRVLGFSDFGKSYLKTLRKSEEVDIIPRLAKLPDFFREHEMKACFTYYMHKSAMERESLRKRELGAPVYIKRKNID